MDTFDWLLVVLFVGWASFHFGKYCERCDAA